jgi:glycosyltransferase involved in cell wall biosynthesis
MTIAIDFVGTDLGSGTKSYSINFCNILNTLKINRDIKVFVCKNYLGQIDKEIRSKNNVKYIVKPNFLSITFFRILWMQFLFPFELKLLGIKTIYSPMNFSPILAKFLNIKIVLCLHSNLPWIYFNLMPGSVLRNFITKKLMELCILTSNLLIVNSNYAKKEIVKFLKLPQKKVMVVYLNINNIYYSKNYKKENASNFFYNKKYILSVMSCVKYHNIINLLSAYKLLINELNYDLKLVLVMQILDKNYYIQIKKYIDSNFKKKKIFLYSNLNNEKLRIFYKRAKLYTFTSYCEVFGLTSLEAFSQKTPVAISNRSALQEINAKAVLYFDPDNINQIKDILKKILIDINLKRRLIKAGKKRLSNFNPIKNIKKTIEIITSI